MIGATPLWVAARFREPEILRALAEYGADPSHQLGGETALMAAIQGGSNRGRFGIAPPDPEEEARRRLESVTAALDAGADADARNANGDTVLHIAASRGLDDVVALLAERGAALDARNGNGQTPLGLASGVTAVRLAELGALDTGGGAGATVTAR
ncbi:MAG: ankyrin repeat domain-containing protein [Acidobacteria bacterium]|nr:ankyrin repeat domain-containing protein [Acidobacteriota bacterium]